MTTPQPPAGHDGDPWAAYQPPTPGASSSPHDGSLPSYPTTPPPPYAAGYRPDMPGHPPVGQRAAPPQRPTTVSTAFWLWMVTLVIGIVSNVVLLSGDYLDRVTNSMSVDMGGDLADAGVDPVAITTTVVLVATLVSLAVSLFIYLFFGIKMVLGRNWARIVLTIFGGLSVLSGLGGSGAMMGAGDVSPPAISQALGWINIIFVLIALVLMFLPTSNRYFKQSKIYRSAPLTIHPMGTMPPRSS